ncbi:SDR family oxidoreductase [Streptomyces sp. SAS_276]|uniref:SDR family oxidoreductase n=1 Tax=Streptomyces sp. SAS_276 TaxID=3412745 RepID=UPI00403C48D9
MELAARGYDVHPGREQRAHLVDVTGARGVEDAVGAERQDLVDVVCGNDPSDTGAAPAQLTCVHLVEQTPLGRVGRAEDVAAAVAFLLSDEAAFVSGIDVLVDGGVCAAVRERAGR